MKSFRVVLFVVLTAFLAAGGVFAQDSDKDREKERQALREKILKKVDERLKTETARIKAEIEQILAEELGAAKRTENKEAKKQPAAEESTEAPAANPGWLGSWVEPLSPELKESLGLDREDGAVIADVIKGGPSDKAGLAKNDLILAFNGKRIANPNELLAQVKATQSGQQVKVVVQRKDGKKNLSLEMGARPTTAPKPPNALVQKKTTGEAKPNAKAEVKVEKRDGEASGKLRDRIKGFLDKMMSGNGEKTEKAEKDEDEGDEGDEADEAKESPKSAKHDPKAEAPGGRLQERVREFMNRVNGGKKGEETAAKGEESDDEAEEGMGDESKGQGLQQLADVAKKFFDEILKGQKGGGKDEGGDEDAESGDESGGPDMNRLLEGAKDWLSKNGGNLPDRLKELQNGNGPGELRDGIQKLLEGIQGKGGDGLKKLLEGIDTKNLPKQLQDMFQGQDWSKYLNPGGKSEEEDTELEEGETKSVPAEREQPSAKAGGAYLGVTLDEVSEELRSHYELGDKGVIVNSVVDGSPAALAGIKQWDIVTSWNGHAVDSVESVIEAVQKGKPGDKAKVVVLRRGKEKALEVTLTARPNAPATKLIQPFHYFVMADGNPGAALNAPKRDDRKKKDEQKTAPARRAAPDQMRDQLRSGLRLLQGFMKDREIYWQLATKDGQVFYKQKIDPSQLAEMARTGGEDFVQSLFSSRFRGGRPDAMQLHSGRKGSTRVYEAPGVRIEIQEGSAGNKGENADSTPVGVTKYVVDTQPIHEVKVIRSIDSTPDKSKKNKKNRSHKNEVI